MKTLLKTASSTLLHARDLFSDFNREGEMLVCLLGAYDQDDAISLGMACVLNRWLSALEEIENALETVHGQLHLAQEAAEPAAPELTPAQKLERSRWQAARFRDVADEVEREAEAKFAATELAEAESSPAEDADPRWLLDLVLSETEQEMLGDLAEHAYEGDVEAAASGLLSAALRAHAQAVAGDNSK